MMEHPLAPIWRDWLALWNGDLSLAPKVVAPGYRLHMEPIGGGGLEGFAGPEGLAAWVGGLHAAINPFTFSVQVPPVYGDDIIAFRWLAEGRYVGGFPGAKAEAGTPILFAGADFLRVEDGMIVEYWLSSDSLKLAAQLAI